MTKGLDSAIPAFIHLLPLFSADISDKWQQMRGRHLVAALNPFAPSNSDGWKRMAENENKKWNKPRRSDETKITPRAVAVAAPKKLPRSQVRAWQCQHIQRKRSKINIMNKYKKHLRHGQMEFNALACKKAKVKQQQKALLPPQFQCNISSSS